MFSRWNFRRQSLVSSAMLRSCQQFSAAFRHFTLSPSSIFAVEFLHSLSSTSSSSNFHNLSLLLQGRILHSHLRQIHARIFRLNAHQDNLVATRLIGHYPSSFALRVFNQLHNPNIFPFNAIIRVLAENGLFFLACSFFNNLIQRSLSPNDLTFSFLLKACFLSNDAQYVNQIHTYIIKLGYLCDPTVCNGLLSVYAQGFKDVASAHKLFDEMPEKGSVTPWTNLIAGYARSGRNEEVLRLFCSMIEKNLRPENDTMVSVLSACSSAEIFDIEKWVTILSEIIHNSDNKIPNRDSVNIALIYLYGRLENVEKSRERFNEIYAIGKMSVIPWNAMIGAYVQNGCPMEALSLFHLMMEDSNCRPNHVTMVSVLSACAQMGDLDLGKWVHQYLEYNGRKGVLETNTFLATALIDMYSKCGDLEMAKRVFDQMISKDVVSFNAMIMGLAMNGEGEEAVSLLSKVQDLGLHPNAGTFLGLLCACSHSGLSEEGRQIFLEMNSRFSVYPRLEHYACYIDILARVGLVEAALTVVDSMPYEPNNFVWGALLGGCVLHSRADLAQKVYKKLVEVDPQNSGGYVMLANTLAVDHRWNDVSVLRWLMREKGVKKQPGHSWISIDGVVHEFLAGSPSHPKMESIYHTLNGLVNVMKVTSP
ncbi:Pentatricopeptide repeat - like 10 [Theobroma cacao]|nr:Pentatricopeptide repeat - like 10 [Theobroma cacao]